MNQTDMMAIPSQMPPLKGLPTLDKSFSLNEEDKKNCIDLVREYSNNMRALKGDNMVNEVMYVQPQSFNLLQRLTNIVLAEYASSLTLCRKGQGTNYTKYSTTLFIGSDEVKISGESDISIIFDNICILTWEDKELSKTLETPAEKGQILAEVKSFADYFFDQVNFEATIFCGVETTGLIWSFCHRYFVDGYATYLLSKPYEVKSGFEMSIKEAIVVTDVILVTNYLIDSLLRCKLLIQQVIDFRKQNSLKSSKKGPFFTADFDDLDESDEDLNDNRKRKKQRIDSATLTSATGLKNELSKKENKDMKVTSSSGGYQKKSFYSFNQNMPQPLTKINLHRLEQRMSLTR
jgi:hypothetical protein